MRKHIDKNDYQFSDTLKTKDSKIRGNCNLLKVKFHELEWSSPLNLIMNLLKIMIMIY